MPVDTGFGLGGFTLDDPFVGSANAFLGKFIRAPDLEPPVGTVLLINLAHGTPKVQCFGNAFFDQGGATGWLHHGRRHIATGNDAVLRAGTGVHQIRIVKEVFVEFDSLRILHQHMAGLTDAGQQFVNRLRHIHHSVLGSDPIFAHGVVAAIKRMKRGMRQPGFIKVEVLHIPIKHGFDGLGVV